MAASITRESQEDTMSSSPDLKAQTTNKSIKSSKFPLSRVKLIMKTDPDLTLASQESVFLIAKASVSRHMGYCLTMVNIRPNVG